MNLTNAQYLEILARLERNKQRTVENDSDAVGEGEEVEKIHKPILHWLRDQLPQPAFVYNRPDKKSTSVRGAPDFVILYRGRVLLIEAKTRQGKLSEDQQIWHRLAEMNGFSVHVCRSFQQFLDLV